MIQDRNLNEEELQIVGLLEWAGTKFLSLEISPPGPKPLKAQTIDYVKDPSEAYGYQAETLRAPIPLAEEISLMDEIQRWILLIDKIIPRRVVGYRIFVHPLNGRYTYPWARIGRLLRKDPRTIKRRWREGIRELTKKADPNRAAVLMAAVGQIQPQKTPIVSPTHPLPRPSSFLLASPLILC